MRQFSQKIREILDSQRVKESMGDRMNMEPTEEELDSIGNPILDAD